MNRRIKKKRCRKEIVRMIEQMKNFQGILLLGGEYVLFDIHSVDVTLSPGVEQKADVVAVFSQMEVRYDGHRSN